MKRKTIHLKFYVLIVLFLSSCASTYRLVDPPSLYYEKLPTNDKVEIEFCNDVLFLKQNRKYYKRQIRNGLSIFAVKVKNISNNDITIGSDIKLFVNQKEIEIIDQLEVIRATKQGVWEYFLYSILFLIYTNTDTETYTNNGQTSVSDNSKTTFIPFGFFIGLGNVIYAASQNKKFSDEFLKYSAANNIIKTAETKYFIICTNSFGDRKISIK